MAGIPGKQSFREAAFETAAFYDMLLAPIAIVASAVAAYDFFWNERLIRGFLLTAASLLALTLSLAKAFVTLRSQRPTRSPHELSGCLEVVYALLTAAASSTPPVIRLTVYRPVESGGKLEQVVDYVGNGQPDPSRVGRRFSVNVGAIGAAFREERVIVADRVNDNPEAFIAELVQDWGYSVRDARRASLGVFAWTALPLIDTDGAGERTVRGIVYIDASESGFFTDDRMRLLTDACSGIALFVKRRYYP
jgi:hypothetical protein